MKQFLAIILFLSVPAAAGAQVKVRGDLSVSVSATLLNDAPLELTTINNLVISGDYGQSKKVYISPVTSAEAGLMKASGRPGSQARITFIMDEIIQNHEGNSAITVRYEMSGNKERIQRSSRLFDTGETTITFGSDGVYYLWLGCSLNTGNAGPGNYQGQFTLEIEYI